MADDHDRALLSRERLQLTAGAQAFRKFRAAGDAVAVADADAGADALSVERFSAFMTGELGFPAEALKVGWMAICEGQSGSPSCTEAQFLSWFDREGGARKWQWFDADPERLRELDKTVELWSVLNEGQETDPLDAEAFETLISVMKQGMPDTAPRAEAMSPAKTGKPFAFRDFVDLFTWTEELDERRTAAAAAETGIEAPHVVAEGMFALGSKSDPAGSVKFVAAVATAVETQWNGDKDQKIRAKGGRSGTLTFADKETGAVLWEKKFKNLFDETADGLGESDLLQSVAAGSSFPYDSTHPFLDRSSFPADHDVAGVFKTKSGKPTATAGEEAPHAEKAVFSTDKSGALYAFLSTRMF